jgi:uncharacterized protein YecE (DUF72 family)
MLRHYNIGAAIADLSPEENLEFLSESVMTTDHSFIRFHGRNASSDYCYNYRYSNEELGSYVKKIS